MSDRREVTYVCYVKTINKRGGDGDFMRIEIVGDKEELTMFRRNNKIVGCEYDDIKEGMKLVVTINRSSYRNSKGVVKKRVVLVAVLIEPEIVNVQYNNMKYFPIDEAKTIAIELSNAFYKNKFVTIADYMHLYEGTKGSPIFPPGIQVRNSSVQPKVGEVIQKVVGTLDDTFIPVGQKGLMCHADPVYDGFVKKILKETDFGNYYEMFSKNGMTSRDSVCNLTFERLIEIGILPEHAGAIWHILFGCDKTIVRYQTV